MLESNRINRREFIGLGIRAAAVTVGGAIIPWAIPASAAEPGKKTGKYRDFSRLIEETKQGFLNPRGITFAADGSMFVCDSGHYRVRKFDREGAEATGRFPLGINPFDPPLDTEITAESLLNFPEDVAVASDGTIFVASTCAGEVAVFDPEGNRIGTVGILGPRDGEMYMPGSLALGREGLLVADSRNRRIQVFNPDGRYQKAYWREAASEEGGKPEEYARQYRDIFRLATSVAVAGDGSLVASDESTGSVFFIRTKEGSPVTEQISWSGFKNPHGVAIDASGRIYVCNTGMSELAVFNADGSFTGRHVAGADSERLKKPMGIAVDPLSQAVFVTDSVLGRVVRIDPQKVQE